ncbi:MAG: hypothetical protein AAF787_17080 [Chloroflexota bacterium]
MVKGIRSVSIVMLLVLMMAFAVAMNAQDEEDGRLNFSYWMDGFGLYCVGSDMQPTDSYAGGGFLLLLEGEEVLFVPEADIETGIATAEATGEFATLGVAVDAYFYPDPGIYYLPESDEFQINIAKSSPDDLREGKLYTFYWTEAECRGGDGTFLAPVSTEEAVATEEAMVDEEAATTEG